MKKKVLIVVTSHNRLGETGKPTGYYLPEVTHPYFELQKAGLEIEIASPLGGKAPMDLSSKDLSDPKNREFLETPHLAKLLDETVALDRVDGKDYAAILFAGGHGTMWDFPNAQAVQRVTREVYENGGVVAAVCHGPAALVNVKLSNGENLISGKRLTGFSNAEEEAAQLTKVMPFLLESALVGKNAKFESAPLWQSRVVVDGRLVTGQNPASASGVGEAVAKILRSTMK